MSFNDPSIEVEDYYVGLERRNEELANENKKMAKLLKDAKIVLQINHKKTKTLEAQLQKIKTKQASIRNINNEPPAGLIDLVPEYRERVEIEGQKRRNEQIESTALKSAKESGPAWKTNMDDLLERGGEPNHIAIFSVGG